MFLGNRYYNEDNISTIDFEIVTEMQSCDVYSKMNMKKATEELWINNLSKNNFKLHKEEGWNNINWVKLSEAQVKNSKETAESRRKSWESMDEDDRDNYRRIGRGFDEHDVEEAERKYKNEASYFSLQKDLLSRKPKFSYVYNEGHIIAIIKMNNGDEFKEPLQYWCHKQGIEKDELKTFEEIKRVYEDEDVSIEYIYDILGTTRKKKNKEYI